LWKVKVGSAYLGFEDEPVVSRCRGFIVIGNAVASEIIGDNPLSLLPTRGTFGVTDGIPYSSWDSKKSFNQERKPILDNSSHQLDIKANPILCTSPE